MQNWICFENVLKNTRGFFARARRARPRRAGNFQNLARASAACPCCAPAARRGSYLWINHIHFILWLDASSSCKNVCVPSWVILLMIDITGHRLMLEANVLLKKCWGITSGSRRPAWQTEWWTGREESALVGVRLWTPWFIFEATLLITTVGKKKAPRGGPIKTASLTSANLLLTKWYLKVVD